MTFDEWFERVTYSRGFLYDLKSGYELVTGGMIEAVITYVGFRSLMKTAWQAGYDAGYQQGKELNVSDNITDDNQLELISMEKQGNGYY